MRQDEHKSAMSDEMKVRFLVNKTSRKILYMEAGKDFVDLLLGFLQLPVVTILSVFAEGEVTAAAMQVGSVSNVYESMRKLSDSCFVVSKDSLLNPPSPLQLDKGSPTLLLPANAAVEAWPNVVYTCNRNHNYFSWVSGSDCPSCGYKMTSSMMRPLDVLNNAVPQPQHTPSASSSGHSQGYVKDYLSFIVTDDLCIMPASTIESIVLLNKLHVEKLSDLDSQEASITAPEALQLLKVSFTTRSALNHVFSAQIV